MYVNKHKEGEMKGKCLSVFRFPFLIAAPTVCDEETTPVAAVSDGTVGFGARSAKLCGETNNFTGYCGFLSAGLTIL